MDNAAEETGEIGQPPKSWDLVLVGEKGKMFFNRGRTEWLTAPKEIQEDFEPPEQTIPRVENEDVEWINACKGGPPALSNFSYAGPFTEMVLLGNLAIRVGKRIEWDGENMKALGAPEADQYVRREYRKGWTL